MIILTLTHFSPFRFPCYTSVIVVIICTSLDKGASLNLTKKMKRWWWWHGVSAVVWFDVCKSKAFVKMVTVAEKT